MWQWLSWRPDAAILRLGISREELCHRNALERKTKNASKIKAQSQKGPVPGFRPPLLLTARPPEIFGSPVRSSDASGSSREPLNDAMAGAVVEAELATGLGRSRDNWFEMQSQCIAAARKSHADAVRGGDGAEFARPCPACARTTDHRRRSRVNDCGILQCSSCGLGRTETAGFDPAAYYTSDYFSGRHRQDAGGGVG